FASRLLSVIPGSLSVLLIYKFGKELFDKNTGLMAALILAVSVFQIKYSQEARTYSLFVFLALLSNYFFFGLLSAHKFKYILGYILISSLLIYDHYYWVFYIAAQNIYVFSKLLVNVREGWSGFKWWILLQFTLVVISIPELIMLSGASAVSAGFWLERPNINAILGILLRFSGSIPLLILFFVLSFNTVLNVFGTNPKSVFKKVFSWPSGLTQILAFTQGDRVFFLIILLFAPIILAFIVSRIYHPIYSAHYLIGASPALYVLVAAGIDKLGFKKAKIFAVILIVFLSLIQVYRYYESVEKPQWREAVNYIERAAYPGDLVMVYPDYEIGSLEYYLKRNDLKTMTLTKKPNLDFDLSGEDAWVIYSYLISADQNGRNEVSETDLEKYNKLLSVKNYYKLKIYHLTGKSD
ncbi:MAG: glycosyltransferase family 39 protein, partial [Thermodesulfobacteriota bacterium]